jgi:hypothetical protein
MSKRLSPAQKTFNKIVRSLRKQGVKSLKPGTTDVCLYRGPGGIRCGVGWIIPNRVYRKSMEGTSAGYDEIADVIRDSGHDVDVAQDMQHCHDGFPVEEWENRFQIVANKYGLKIPPVTT